jgi:hypothetical protein
MLAEGPAHDARAGIGAARIEAIEFAEIGSPKLIERNAALRQSPRDRVSLVGDHRI